MNWIYIFFLIVSAILTIYGGSLIGDSGDKDNPNKKNKLVLLIIGILLVIFGFLGCCFFSVKLIFN